MKQRVAVLSLIFSALAFAGDPRPMTDNEKLTILQGRLTVLEAQLAAKEAEVSLLQAQMRAAQAFSGFKDTFAPIQKAAGADGCGLDSQLKWSCPAVTAPTNPPTAETLDRLHRMSQPSQQAGATPPKK